MKIQEIIEEINYHLNTDVKKFVSVKNNEDVDVLVYNILFDITNSIPENNLSPYFEIESIQMAKEILKSIFEIRVHDEGDDTFESKFNLILDSKRVDFSKKLFLSVYNT